MMILEPYSVRANKRFDCRLNCSRSLGSFIPGSCRRGETRTGRISRLRASLSPEASWVDFAFSCVRAGLLLAGLAWEIGYPILYDNFLNLGAVIPLGLGAMREQVGCAPRVAFQCAIHQPLQEQLEARCQLRSATFAVCGGSILDLADDFTDKLAFAALGGAAFGITRNAFFESRMLGWITAAGFTHRPKFPHRERRNPCCNRYP